MTDRQLREALWLNVIELKEIYGEEIADLASKPIRELTRAEMLDLIAKRQHLFNPDMGTADNVRPVHASADVGPARRRSTASPPVSRAVNKAGNESPEMVEPLSLVSGKARGNLQRLPGRRTPLAT
jgi:hypothetical protein